MIQFLGFQPDRVVEDLLGRCSAFVFAAEEDFGIAPVEALAAGAPVIAFGKGGALETVIAGETGVLFPEQTVDSLIAAVATFDQSRDRFHPEHLRRSAMRFGRERFQQELRALIEREQARFAEMARVEA
jgi:glycosyltransferase involved in cell wall biosynthesis